MGGFQFQKTREVNLYNKPKGNNKLMEGAIHSDTAMILLPREDFMQSEIVVTMLKHLLVFTE